MGALHEGIGRMSTSSLKWSSARSCCISHPLGSATSMMPVMASPSGWARSCAASDNCNTTRLSRRILGQETKSASIVLHHAYIGCAPCSHPPSRAAVSCPIRHSLPCCSRICTYSRSSSDVVRVPSFKDFCIIFSASCSCKGRAVEAPHPMMASSFVATHCRLSKPACHPGCHQHPRCSLPYCTQTCNTTNHTQTLWSRSVWTSGLVKVRATTLPCT